MPEHIRALIVILVLSSTVFAIAKQPACQLIPAKDFSRRRNAWFGITLAAFLAHSFWIYVIVSSAMILMLSKRENRPVALFLILAFAVPAAQVQIPGLGLVNYLFSLTHQRLLALVILFPAFLILIGRKNLPRFGHLLPDKLIASYMVLVLLLFLRETSITDVFRQGFYLFVDVFLPYYVISRSIRTIDDFRHVLLAFVLATMVISLIGVFEATRHWLLYKSLIGTLDMNEAMTGYLERSGILRAITSVGHPIALGYVMTVALGFYLFLQRFVRRPLFRHLGFLLILSGLLAALSRGPWVGAVFSIFVFIATGRYAIRKLAKLSLAAIVALLIVSVMPGGDRIIGLIPFVGETEKGNISYRERLFTNSIVVIQRHPLLGSVNFRAAPEMQELRQGQGIIDIVNSYIGIALETGFVGLTLFAGFFIAICWQLFKSIRSIRDHKSQEHLLGRCLLATLLGIMLIIATVSSITIIPLVYWSVAGICVAYIVMIKQQQRRARTRVVSGELDSPELTGK